MKPIETFELQPARKTSKSGLMHLLAVLN